MRKFRRFFCIALCLYLLLCSAADLLPRASAASDLTASEACIDFIKKVEGFSAKPYYDYQQHTVGYGTKCPTDKYFEYMANGISREEAEILLRQTVAEVGNTVNQLLIDKYNLVLNQHQFDALVSFSFNIGTSWMTYDSTLRNALLQNADVNELVYAFSLYSTAGGQYLSGLISRRLCEANIYLNGVYSQNVDDTYGYVFYEPNGGSLTYRIQGFLCDNNAVPKADAARNGDGFLGWYTDLSGGTQVTVLSRALSGKTLFARWQSSANEESENAVSTVVSVTGDVVNIRKGPGTTYGIAKQVYRNDLLIVSHVTKFTNMTWGKVQDGWICLDYTNYNQVVNGTDHTGNGSNTSSSAGTPSQDTNSTPSGTTATPNTQQTVTGIVRVNDLLRIRSGPGITYPTAGYLTNGTTVQILEQAAGDGMMWGRISRGWVSMNYIFTETVSPTVPTTPVPDQVQPSAPEENTQQNTTGSSGTANPTTITGKIIADALRIRTGAGTEYPVVGYYYQNETVTIWETRQAGSLSWGKTDRGWIQMDYVLTETPATKPTQPSEGVTMTVIADCLRVRKGTGTEYKISALLYYGDKVTVLETTTVNGVLWGRIAQGWICMDYVK